MKRLLVILILILIVALFISFVTDRFKVRYKSEIDYYADEYSIDRHLVYALIKAESSFDPDAVSHKGAVGLMQVTGETALWCAEKIGDVTLAERMNEPDVNLKIGCFYLSYLLKRYSGSETAALAAYNAGAGNADKWLCDSEHSPDGASLSSSPFPETDGYLKKVMLYKKVYEFLYNE